MQPDDSPNFEDDASSDPSPVDSAKAAEALAQVREAHATLRRLVEVIEEDGRYPVEAYRFLQEGLDLSVRRTHGVDMQAHKKTRRRRRRKPQPALDAQADTRADDDHAHHPHHVSGAQLCDGLRELAVARWGYMAKSVLNAWNIHETRDFGEMVFVLVDNDFLQKTEGDRREDFDGLFPLRDLEGEYQVPIGVISADELVAGGGSL